MPVAKITGQGLSAIALSVALLWGCLIAERVTRGQADAMRVQVLHDLERLQKRPRPIPIPIPVSVPASAQRPQVTVG
jgi:hypothetical protein